MKSVHTGVKLRDDSPEFVPPSTDLDALLNATVGPNVALLVHALHDEHRRMDQGQVLQLSDPAITIIAAADKVIAR